MRNASIFDIYYNVGKITTERALEIIDSLSPEEILEQDRNGNTILHILAGPGMISYDLKQIVSAIVAKNAEVLNLTRPVEYTDPTTKETKLIDGDNAIAAAIRHPNLELLKILMPYYQNLSEFRMFDFRVGEQRNMTPEELEKLKEKSEEHPHLKTVRVKILDNVREFLSPLAFTMRYGQFEMFKYLVENGFGQEIKGIQNIPQYHLDTTEDLQALYKDLFVAGNKGLLKELHNFLDYYEGHNGENSQALVDSLQNNNKELALDLISQGHYIYDFSDLPFPDTAAKFIFSKCLHHPNYNIMARDESGLTPLYYAIDCRDHVLVKSILEAAEYNYDFLKNSFNNHDFFHPKLFFQAVQTKDNKTIAELISATKDHPELLRTVLEPCNRYGDTALNILGSSRNTEAIEMFLSAGICPPLSMLLQNSFSTEIKILLLKSYIKNHAYNAFSIGWDALAGAAKSYSGDIAEAYEQKPKQSSRDDNQNQR